MKAYDSIANFQIAKTRLKMIAEKIKKVETK